MQPYLDALWAIVFLGLELMVVWLVASVAAYAIVVAVYFNIHYWRARWRKRGSR